MILVIGGTGRLGRQVVEALYVRSERVRVLTRDPARHLKAQPIDVEVVRGDLLDRDSLVAALHGVQSVVVTAHGGGGTGKSGPGGVEGKGLPQLIDVATTTPLKQFVYLSTTSAHPQSPAGFFRAKAAVQKLLAQSPIPHTVVRPTHLLDTWVPLLAEPLVTKSRQMIIGNGDNPVSWVAGSDVAHVVAELACQPGNGSRLDLGGPEALTLRELSTLIQGTLQITPTKTTVMGPGMLRMSSAFTRPFNGLLARQMQLGALLDTQPQVIDSSAVWAGFDVVPTPIQGWLDASMPALRARWVVD